MKAGEKTSKAIITAGHHNNDSGAIGNGFKENVLNREVRDLTTARLRQLRPDLEVWNDDDNDTLSSVIKKINAFGTAKDLQLEIHFDSSVTPKPSGATALVADGASARSRAFAKDLVDITSDVLDVPNRGVKSEKDSHRGRLGILHTKPAAVLLEVGFISNPTDVSQYKKWSHWLAEELALVIIKHL